MDQLEETASLDALIDRLLEAKNQDELTKIVGENILRCLCPLVFRQIPLVPVRAAAWRTLVFSKYGY